MTQEKDRLIIFDGSGDCLGDLIFEHDLFSQAMLYPKGEEILGGWLEDWQVSGIMYLHPESANSKIATKGEYVPMRSHEFPSALRQWLERRGFYSFIIPESSWELWNNIELLPLTSEEKFQFGILLSGLSQKDQALLKNSLESFLKRLYPTSSPKKKKTSASAKKTSSQAKALKKPAKKSPAKKPAQKSNSKKKQ